MKKILIIASICSFSPLLYGEKAKPHVAESFIGLGDSRLAETFKRIVQANREMETLSFSCSYQSSLEQDPTLDYRYKKQTYHWKRETKSSLQIEEIERKDIFGERFEKVTTYFYYNNEKITSFERTKRNPNEISSTRYIGEREEVHVYSTIPLFFKLQNDISNLTRTFSGEIVASVLENADMKKLNYNIVDYKGSKCLNLTFFEEDEQGGVSTRAEFLFDMQTGRLLKRTMTWPPETKQRYEIEIEKQLEIKGVYFPLRLTQKLYVEKDKLDYETTTIFDEKSIKIDEHIPDSIFIPVLHEGTLVRDDILKKEYFATGLSDPEKEKIITKELDKIFEGREK